MNKKAKRGLILTVLLLLLVLLHVQKLGELPSPKPIQTKATMEEKRENKRIAYKFSKALGYTRAETTCLITLWTRESRFDHLGFPKNSKGEPASSAFGIAQLLGERSREPELQILRGLRYLEHRYGKSACRALQHSDRLGWY